MSDMKVWTILFWLTASLLLYTQLGYPLLMALIARLPKRRTRLTKDIGTLSVTLIIPAYNEEVVIEAKLENSLRVEYPKDKYEILLASDASTDRTVSIAREFEPRGIRVLAFATRRGKPSVINDAVEVATGDVLCLCDANVMFRPDALRRLVAKLEDPRVGAATGDVRLASQDATFGVGESLYYRIERSIQEGESRVGCIMSVDGGMYVMRRELFQPLPKDALNEDSTNTMRVIRQGKRVVYEPEAIASEDATPTARQEFRRRVRITAGAMGCLRRGEYPPFHRPIEVWQFVSHKLLRWVGPVLLLAVLLSNLVIWRQGRIYQACLIAQGCVYFVAGVATVSLRFRRMQFGGIPFYFVMSHVAMGVGLIRGFVRMPRITWAKPGRRVCEQPDTAPLGSTVGQAQPDKRPCDVSI